MKLNLGCSDQFLEGFIGVDVVTPKWATSENFVRADLRHSWPFADSSVDHIRAWDIVEHLVDKIHTANEIYRILKPGGTVEIVVPTTDGRGAWQDPTHVSFWNRNSFFYFESGNPHLTRFREGNGVKCEFKILRERAETLIDSVVKLHIVLEAVKTVDKNVEAAEKRPRFSIIHPSARPSEWHKVYTDWCGNAVLPEECEYILVCDRKFFSQLPVAETFQGRIPLAMVWSDDPANYVANVNKGAKLSTGEILTVVADDQYPCEKWDMEIHMSTRLSGDFVLAVSTGTPHEHESEILVMPILSRAYYEKYGHVFYPKYESMYADNDFFARAKRDGALIPGRALMFPHRHWLNGQREKDAADEAQNRSEAYQVGHALFEARKAHDFADVTVEWKPGATRKTVALLTPGNSWGFAWLDHWSKLLLHVASKYTVIPMQAYSSNVYMVRGGMAKAILAHPVKPDYIFWLDDDNALTVEQFDMLMKDLDEHPEIDSVSAWTWCGGDDYEEEGTASISCGQVVSAEFTGDGKDIKFGKTRSISVKQLQDSPSDLIEIGYSGFPAVLMRAELLSKAGPHPFNPFVDERCDDGMSGEDLAFFMRAKLRGNARFALDRRVYVPHFKRRPIEPKVVRLARQESVV